MENTLNNKGKFFALYWGQKLRIYPEFVSSLEWEILSDRVKSCNNLILHLKDISSFTEGDRYNLSITDFQSLDDKGYILRHGRRDYFTGYDVDFLRSKGYAITFMGLSVEEQIEYGWIKLIN